MFITFEGPDGSGKTTALNSLVKLLKEKSIDFVLTREPGSRHISKTNEAIRELIVGAGNDMTNMTEAILFAADRRLHLEKVIWPALKENRIVLCDRYFDSTFAYQGKARGLGIDKMIDLNDNITDKTYPDLTIYFDLSPEESIRRVNARGEKNRLDKEGEQFVKNVHLGYHELINRFKNRYRIVDATKSKEEVLQQVIDIFKKEVPNTL